MAKKQAKATKKTRAMCGLIMPISKIDDCSEKHWSDVKTILTEAVHDAGLEARLVSDSEYSGIIHKDIVENLYNDKLVICDVSANNPNVMFELGIRLTFDKPTILIKDDVTRFNFDTGPIRHIPYRRDLRYRDMVEFKEELTRKIEGTIKESKDPNYSVFIKAMGPYIVPKLDTKTVTTDKYVLEELKQLSRSVEQLSSRIDSQEIARRSTRPSSRPDKRRFSGSELRELILERLNQYGDLTEDDYSSASSEIQFKIVNEYPRRILNTKIYHPIFQEAWKSINS